jgi:hypothetical protein
MLDKIITIPQARCIRPCLAGTLLIWMAFIFPFSHLHDKWAPAASSQNSSASMPREDSLATIIDHH